MERFFRSSLYSRRLGTRVLPRPLLIKRSAGFTLVETMVVVAIVAILGSIAAPSFQEMIRKNRLTAASSALQVSLNLARSEAVKRGTDARVTIAPNGSVGNWTGGWTVFVDGTTNANGAVAPSADSAPSCVSNCVSRLEVVAAPAGALSFSQTGTVNYFTYNGQGRLIDVSGAGVVNRSVWFSDGASEKYCLIINNTGRVRTALVADSVTCASAGS
jgi:type IV fimbrial biogenesis protein FimT